MTSRLGTLDTRNFTPIEELPKTIEEFRMKKQPTTSGSRIGSFLAERKFTPWKSPIEKPKSFMGTREILNELKIDPFSFKNISGISANPVRQAKLTKLVFGKAWNTLKDTVTQSADELKDFFDISGRPTEEVGEKLKEVAAVGHIVFSPISAFFEGANEIPVLGSVSKLVSLPFVVAGDVGMAISGKIVDELPISQQSKDDIKEGVQEISALAAQLAIGKITHIGTKKVKELKTKFGNKDAQVIVKKATEWAEQAKEPVPKTKPKTIEPLAQEAGKYKSAEEFYERIPTNIRNEFRDKGIRGKEQLTKFWNKNVTPKEPILDSLNPTGGLFVDYTPKSRATMKLGDNITTLDKTSKKSPDTIITIYRGAPKSQKGIVAGDYITTNYDLAKSYTGDGNVLSKKVKMKNVLDDIESPLGEEYIYKPLTQATKGVKPGRKFIDVPKEQLPIKTPKAEKGVSRLEARMKGVLSRENVKIAKDEAKSKGLDISIYDKMTKSDQIRKAADYVRKTPQYKVLEVLEGKRPAPKGILDNAIALALEQKSKMSKNKELAMRLASLRSTRMGQELSILTEVSGTSPVAGLSEIIRARRDIVTNKLKQGETLKTKKTSYKNEIKTEQTKTQVKVSEFGKILKDITC